MRLALKLKLLPDVSQKAALLKTMEHFSALCDHISRISFEKKVFSAMRMHYLAYYDIRKAFPEFSSQFVVRAIAKVADSYVKHKKTVHAFRKHSSVVYDQRLLSFKITTASINTTEGRKKIPFVFRQYGILDFKAIKSQTLLTYDKGQFFLSVVVDYPDKPKIPVKEFLGVDLGIKNIAYTSDGLPFSGEKIEKVRKRYAAIRGNLQSSGTKSAKRHLQKLSKKEHRFRKDINHQISKTLVSIAEGTGRGIALENLKGIRRRTTVRKEHRAKHESWSFSQLRQFINYKASLSGVPVAIVPAMFTSQICPRCGHCCEGNRKSRDLFVCQNCHYTAPSDYVGALNVSRAAANPPIAASSFEPQARLLQGTGS
jgi:putative transposase